MLRPTQSQHRLIKMISNAWDCKQCEIGGTIYMIYQKNTPGFQHKPVIFVHFTSYPMVVIKPFVSRFQKFRVFTIYEISTICRCTCMERQVDFMSVHVFIQWVFIKVENPQDSHNIKITFQLDHTPSAVKVHNHQPLLEQNCCSFCSSSSEGSKGIKEFDLYILIFCKLH